MKKETLKCITLQSREAMEAAVADVVHAKLQYATLTAEMETAITTIQKQYQKDMLPIGRKIELLEVAVQLFCERNRGDLFAAKKSLDTLVATLGFRDTPPRVEKARSKETWGKIAIRLAALVWGEPYIREPDPEVNKEALLADRTKLTEQQITDAGIRFESEELFYIEPKSQMAAATTSEAA